MPSSHIRIALPAGDQMPAYLARPDGQAPRAGIVVLQEIFGINANIRAIADGFAASGYAAIVPDLFWRQQAGVELDPADAGDRARAMALAQGLDQELAVADARAAADHLRTQGDGPIKVGAVGYCLGGKLAYLLSAGDGIDAAVSYYGVAIQAALDRAGEVKTPLLLHIAMADELCPPDAQQAIHAALDASPHVTIVDHPGVGHAFARDGGAAFDAAAAGRADGETARFFERWLLR